MAKQRIVYREVIDGVDGAPAWITTFVDMVSLLVTFFILLYTFSSIRAYDAFTYPRNVVSTSGMFEGDSSDTIVAPDQDLMLGMDIARGSRKRHTRPVDQLLKNMEDMGQKLTEDQIQVDLNRVNDGMRIQFPEDQGFAPGDSTISAGLEKALAELAGAVQYYPVMLVVEGHTDDAFLSTPTYPDAQSLSIARARAAADALVDAGGFDPSLLMIEGLGSAVPKDPTKTGPKARRADRRVEVRVVSMSKDRIAAQGVGAEK